MRYTAVTHLKDYTQAKLDRLKPEADTEMQQAIQDGFDIGYFSGFFDGVESISKHLVDLGMKREPAMRAVLSKIAGDIIEQATEDIDAKTKLAKPLSFGIPLTPPF